MSNKVQSRKIAAAIARAEAAEAETKAKAKAARERTGASIKLSGPRLTASDNADRARIDAEASQRVSDAALAAENRDRAALGLPLMPSPKRAASIIRSSGYPTAYPDDRRVMAEVK